MARLAQSSEYTILRTSGLGPWRALRTLLVLGLGFVVLTFAVGDYLAPAADRTAQLLKARYQGGLSLVGKTGAWLKEKQGDMSYAVNVGVASTATARCRRCASSSSTRDGFIASQTAAPSARACRRRAGCCTTSSAANTTRATRRQRARRSPRRLPALRLADRAHQRDGVGRAAQARPHAHARPVPVHPPPGRQRPDLAALRDRVLAQGVLSAVLPGDGGARPALRLPALPLRRHHDLRVRRRA